MIDTLELTQAVRRYRERCRTANRQPTFKGIALDLGVSSQTVANVVHGIFNGRRYTKKPHISRCVDNSDFDLIRALFEHH